MTVAAASDRPNDRRVPGFTTKTLLHFADGVAPSTLNHWVMKGYVEPSLLGSEGRQRADRYWSIEDAVVVRSIYRLRRWRAPDSVLMSLRESIRGSGQGDLLQWSGKHLVELRNGTEVGVVPAPGQVSFSTEVFHLVTIPLSQWFTEATAKAGLHDIESLRKQRLKSANRRGILDPKSGKVILDDEHLIPQNEKSPGIGTAGGDEPDQSV